MYEVHVIWNDGTESTYDVKGWIIEEHWIQLMEEDVVHFLAVKDVQYVRVPSLAPPDEG